MILPALLTSAGFNIVICVGFFSLYSILRKQPYNLKVYFGQRLAQLKPGQKNLYFFDRLIPSAGWLVKAWEATDDDLYACGGIDGLVFIGLIVFCIRIFSIAAVLCIFIVLPVNLFGQAIEQTTPDSQMDIFTIRNVPEGSTGLWAHFFALYVISISAYVLLYVEFKNVARLRLEQAIKFPRKPSHYTVLVRGIPWSPGESYSEVVSKHFSSWYNLSYLAHQMVYRSGAIQKLMVTICMETEKMYKVLAETTITQYVQPITVEALPSSNPLKIVASETESTFRKHKHNNKKDMRDLECAAAFVFFRNRYAAMVASHTIQAKDPMLWVTDFAPEPQDVYWANLCIPYRYLWIRKTLVFIGTILFSVWFLLPTSLVQGLCNLAQLETTFPFLRGIADRKYVNIISGYLPSLVLTFFVLLVPPVMLMFATLEGAVSRSGRKKSACCKVIIFFFWNIFLYNLFTGTWWDRMHLLTVSGLKDMATLLGVLVPGQAPFFMTYIMTTGWASLAYELMQPFVLIVNWFCQFVLMRPEGYGDLYTFPYHTEVPRALLFALLGFTFSILAPLILPFLLVYYFFAYFVYRNQILNVYITRYNTNGSYWPIAHNSAIFSLIVMQSVASIIFGMKRLGTASGFAFILIIFTLLFNLYCRHKFLPLFTNKAVQVYIASKHTYKV
ncbi:hyperosmolality-gated Ca2+ permeable channel 2.1-like [Bidens hawaiensis]|uniref:hyperosmolality-gated Ca2+ permeable channel 2.1-like n=1 Tax=Bidens hawaiensis TaxID=980011 RepID=UPI00404AA1D4